VVNETLRRVVRETLRAQAFYIEEDPYGNSYSPSYKAAKDYSPKAQSLGRGGYVTTRNYEMDSGAYFFRLLWHYWKKTGELLELAKTAHVMVDTWVVEQKHEELSPYRYPELVRNGLGPSLGYTGMSFTPFRPSDDQTKGYNIPGNQFGVLALTYVTEMAREWADASLERKAERLKLEVWLYLLFG